MELEFKSFKDDAWFDARVVTEGRRGPRLRIKFTTFGDDQDEVIHAKKLKSLDDVDALRSRFRKISVQFQDSDCSNIEPGLLVCARRDVGENDRKFYDAVLREVVRKKHRVENGGEVCTCTFVLDWIDNGLRGSCSVENICRVVDTVDEDLDPAVVSFLNKVRERIESTPLRILRVGNKDTSPSTTSIALSSSVEGMSVDSNVPLGISYEAVHAPKRHKKGTSPAREPLALSCYVEGSDNASGMDGRDDMDVGGAPYMVIVENLEKGISPFTIMEFLHQQVSVTCQASVSASKFSELYTRAIILLDGKKNLDKLSDFLWSSDHIIISSRGRPWLMTEKGPLPDALRASFQSLSQMALDTNSLSSNELSVVRFGSVEYMKAKELQKLVGVFIKHQGALLQSLERAEGKISEKYMRMS